MIEIEREIVIRNHQTNRSWCLGCGQTVEMLSVAEAAQVINQPEATIYEQVDAQVLHFAAMANGFLVICPNSLLELNQLKTIRSLAQAQLTDGADLTDHLLTNE
jgi:hypothetical protein